MVEDEKDYEDIADIAEYNAVFHELFGDKEPRKRPLLLTCQCLCTCLVVCLLVCVDITT